MRVALALLVVTAFAASAGAWDCYQEGSPELTTPATGVSLSSLTVGGEDPGVYYVDSDACQPGCAFSVWVYEETNGIPGLQRGDLPKDGCYPVESDTIIL